MFQPFSRSLPTRNIRSAFSLNSRSVPAFASAEPSAEADFGAASPAGLPPLDGERTLSGIYAMFDPEEAQRGLGIFTMLKEIEFAISNGKEFYYQGYAYEGESFYDYKKRFRGTECFDWRGGWEGFSLDGN